MRKQGTGTFGTEVVCAEIRMCSTSGGGTAMRVKLLSGKAGAWMDVPVGSNIDVGDRYTLVLTKMKDGDAD